MCRVCNKISFYFFILAILFIPGCSNKQNANETEVNYTILPEINPIEIKLATPFDSNSFEYSGLTTYKNNLILLPQYFFGFDKDTIGYIYSIGFNRLEDYLNGENKNPISPDTIEVYGNGFQRFNHRGSGYEGITFIDNNVYIVIEDIGSPTKAYIAKGFYNETENKIRLDSNTLVELPQQSYIENFGYETILNYSDNILAIQELNGKNNSVSRNVIELNAELNFTNTFKLPEIEYRITDATVVSGNYFYVINYLWPGDLARILPSKDKIAEKYGIGRHQSVYKGIERILRMQIKGDSIIVAGEPIYISKEDDESSNWEGIAKFGNGFLLITDTFPKTKLVYVEP